MRSWGQNEVKEWEAVKNRVRLDLKRGVVRPRDLEDIAALESLADKVEESKGHPDE